MPSRIEDYALLGDCETVALVARDGSIDWLSWPRFDSGACFAALLGGPEHGRWRLAPVDRPSRTIRRYRGDTLILETDIETPEGAVSLIEFMPPRTGNSDLVRLVVGRRGRVRMRTELIIRFDYGAAVPWVFRLDDGALCAITGPDRLVLRSSVPVHGEALTTVSEFWVEAGETVSFDLTHAPSHLPPPGAIDPVAALAETEAFWQAWSDRPVAASPWSDAVKRSLIVLKALTYRPTGGIVAAPTTSLPERIGGNRNWDYRYVWVRDAAFSVYALLRLGFTDEAAAFVRFLSERLGEAADGADDELGPLRVLYDLDGGLPHERELDHLAGYRDSRPVRVGNGAVDQLQLDVYGEIVDSVYLFDKHGRGISHDAWSDLRAIVAWLMDNWQRPDAGMWEIRSEPRTHTTSLVMSWVAVERMMRVARRRGLPGDLTELAATRDKIYERVMTECWNDELGAFTAFANSDVLDAGALLMPMVKMLAPDDPRFLSTLAAIEDRLVTDSLVLRYDSHAFGDGVTAGDGEDGEDGEGGHPVVEGTFSLCSFWYVEALTRAGRLADARLALEKMFTYANHLGQYAEQVALNGEQLGNFPQGFTHLSLVSAVINLDRSLDG
jgi:GH15 family glucan-1,4-alpha-glucosidase